MYSIYRDTDAKFVLFTTKKGLVKKTGLDEYINTKKTKGIGAISLKDGDSLASVTLIKDEPLIIVSKKGQVIKFNSDEISPTSRMTSGVKGINLNPEDEVITTLPLRNSTDQLAVFSTKGHGKKMAQSELTLQKRGGKGVCVFKSTDLTGELSAAQLISDEDNVLLIGSKSSICISATEIPLQMRTAIGNIILKDKILSVSKV